jgi:predicted signal transduction protein with EAL and GGDEF domain
LAEGVETPAEFDFLENEHCDEAQGYLLGKPGTIESFRHFTHGEGVAEEPPVVAREPAVVAEEPAVVTPSAKAASM